MDFSEFLQTCKKNNFRILSLNTYMDKDVLRVYITVVENSDCGLFITRGSEVSNIEREFDSIIKEIKKYKVQYSEYEDGC